MPDENVKKRGRPKKQTAPVETQSQTPDTTANVNEYSSKVYTWVRDAIFGTGVFYAFEQEDVLAVLEDPILNYKLAVKIANYVYTKSGIVSGAIDYMTALPCLDNVIVYNSPEPNKIARRNKATMRSVLKSIDDKHFIRDALHTEMRNGVYLYYFETRERPEDYSKYLSDWDVHSIFELNTAGLNARIITLPWDYTKIIGRMNDRYVLAFDLRYFDMYASQDELRRRLMAFPQEIQNGYHDWKNNSMNGNPWLVLDHKKTMCGKIKSRDSELWGRPLAISALNDILYQDQFLDTKRHVLDNINHDIFVHEFPEGEKKGSCALTKPGQEQQHADVRDAIVNKNNVEGTSFVSVASGTKLSHLKIETDGIFDDSTESELNNTIALDLGICAALLGAMTTGGNYSAQVNNLQMVTSQIYQFVHDIQEDLNYVINENILHSNEQNKVSVFYFPTSFVNRKEFFEQMKTLYTFGGSFSFMVAAAGIDPELYTSVLRNEYDENLFDIIKPHPTSYTMSSEDINENKGGRPELDDPVNDETIKSRGTGGNNLPSPSDNQ